MDSDTFAKLATAIIDLTNTSPPDAMMQNQQVFGAHSVDFSNKPPSTSKPDIHMRTNDTFTSNVNSSGFFTPNIPVPSSHHEQVPMDDFDPLESFTFWDGETFYCNQDLENECCAASSMPPEEEMPELQGYLIHSQTLTKDDFSLIEDSDLIHNPTLAELNAGRETVFDCSAESSFLSEDSGYLLSPEFLSKSVPLNESSFIHPSSMFVSTSSAYANNINCFPGNFPEPKNSPQSLLSSSCPVPSRVAPCPQYLNPYDERLLLCPQNSPSSPDSFIQRKEQFSVESHRPLSMHDFSKSVLSSKHLTDPSVLSTSAPPEVTMAIQPSNIKTESPRPSFGLGKQTPERTLSGFSSLSLSNDDESGSYFDDSDHDLDDFSSDEDAYQFDEGDDTFSTSWPPNKEAKAQQRKHRFFWQYNLQARGIKTQNLLPLSEEHDPYKLNDVKDPVFSEECALPVKHSGKARKGDGNDLTPNARKLYSIGMELKKLNRLIYNLNPTSDVNMHTKPLSRKEKNKLASRVCRLKKKAQHEANKIKLYGLQQEHKRLLTILYDLRRLIKYKIEHFGEVSDSTSFQKLENYLASHEPIRVAGNTTEFVNEVLEKVSRGEPDGGLGKL